LNALKRALEKLKIVELLKETLRSRKSTSWTPSIVFTKV